MLRDHNANHARSHFFLGTAFATTISADVVVVVTSRSPEGYFDGAIGSSSLLGVLL
jgi:hypothetical protein